MKKPAKSKSVWLVWLFNLVPGLGLGFLYATGTRGLPVLIFCWFVELFLFKSAVIQAVYFTLSLLGTLCIVSQRGKEATTPQLKTAPLGDTEPATKGRSKIQDQSLAEQGALIAELESEIIQWEQKARAMVGRGNSRLAQEYLQERDRCFAMAREAQSRMNAIKLATLDFGTTTAVAETTVGELGSSEPDQVPEPVPDEVASEDTSRSRLDGPEMGLPDQSDPAILALGNEPATSTVAVHVASTELPSAGLTDYMFHAQPLEEAANVEVHPLPSPATQSNANELSAVPSTSATLSEESEQLCQKCATPRSGEFQFCLNCLASFQ